MTEQQKEYRKMLQKRTSNIKAIKTYYSITNNYIIKWKPPEATIINLEAMNSIKYHSAALMVSNTFIRWYNISHLWSSQNPNVNTDIVIALIQLFKWWRHLHLYWKISRLWSEIVVMIVKQTFGLVSKGFNLQKPRATYTSQNGVFTERVRWHMCWRALKGIGIPD